MRALPRFGVSSRRYAAAAGILGALAASRYGTLVVRGRKTSRHLQKFTPIEDLDTFVETRPKMYGGPTKSPHAVLLIHGYSASPSEFDDLAGELRRRELAYYAPRLTGFGLGSYRLLFRTDLSDWLRDAVDAYDLLSELADEVSVVGHSFGAALAVYVAQNRPVRHLILSGPSLFVGPSDRFRRRLARYAMRSHLPVWTVPVIAKPVRPGRATFSDTLDPDAARRAFSYPTLPVRSLHSQWTVFDKVDIALAQFETLTVAYGEQDLTVDIQSLLGALREKNIRHRALSFPRSGHNIMQDYDKLDAVRAIAETLTGDVDAVAS